MRFHHFCILFFMCLCVTGIYCFATTDVLFLVDSTGSMNGLLIFQAAFNDIIDAIEADSCPENIMYSIADYRNRSDGGNYTDYGVNLDQSFTKSALEVQLAISGLTAAGGGDEEESQLKAFISIVDNWLTSSGDLGFGGRSEAKKMIIWAGDQPGHDIADDIYYPALNTVINSLTAQGIVVFALNPSGYHSGLDALYNGHYQASEITTSTGGTLFNNVQSATTAIIDAIIDELVCFEFIKDDDLDDEDPSDCRQASEEIEYTISWTNTSGHALTDAWILDRLPLGVTYPISYTLDPNTMEMISSDSAYDSNNHEYVWYIGSIPNWASGSVSLTVVVNSNAILGMNLTNIAELYDGESLVATATEKTLVCCLENPTTTIYVDKYATGANLGLDWPNAYNSLNNALTQASESVCDTNFTIFVAQGTYSPGGSEDDRFVLPDEISVYGGFPTGGCDFNLRNPKRYLTILSGTIDRFLRNGTVLEMGDNCLIDGFTISEAGEYCIHGSGVDFSIAQCTIENSDQYGIYASNSNIDLAWCIFRNNRDGIMHSGAGYILNVDNCWLMKQRQIGITCESSTPMLRNSIVTESDLSETGNAGIRMVNPSSQPVFQNCTISHNKSVGISLAGIGTPSLINSIVYHNNSGGPQLSTNLNPDVVAQYCCIADCNEVNNNINIDPKFVYYDPNNVRIQSNSPCHDSGLTLSENYTQVDMDNRTRVLGFAVDRGAYEIECEDTNHELDWNHDGLVNMVEFNVLARAWQSRDPNDPAIITDPNYIGHRDYADPNTLARWRTVWFPGGQVFDLNEDLRVDLTDLALFCNEDWLWRACWLNLEELQMQQMAFGGEDVMFMTSVDSMALDGMQTLSDPVEPQLSVEEQIAKVEDSLVFLSRLWLEEPDLQQQISPEDWREFMLSVYQSLLDLKTQSFQIE